MKKQNKLYLVIAILLAALCIFLFFNRNNSPEPAIDDGGEDIQINEKYVEYHFRNKDLLDTHYNKHGKDMGFGSKEEYEKAASDVANNPEALHKLEKEDGDDVYYIEKTNEFVVVSTDGYIRTYFCPDNGKKYFDKQ